MTGYRPIFNPLAAAILIAGVYILSVFWLKLDRIAANREQLTGQFSQLSSHLNTAHAADASRKILSNTLKEQQRIHPRAPAEDVARVLRTALAQALPGIQQEVATGPGNPIAASAGLSLLPVTITLRIGDETLLDTVRAVEALRPGLVVARLHARKSDTRRAGPPGAMPQLDVTISGHALIDVAAPGAKK